MDTPELVEISNALGEDRNRWEARVLTAERQRDEALEALRELRADEWRVTVDWGDPGWARRAGEQEIHLRQEPPAREGLTDDGAEDAGVRSRLAFERPHGL